MKTKDAVLLAKEIRRAREQDEPFPRDWAADLARFVLFPSRLELPTCAAIQGPNGITFAGKRHHDCLAQIKAAGFGGLWRIAATQGFMTNRGRFVDRSTAYQMRIDAGLPSADSVGYRGTELYSEDLY